MTRILFVDDEPAVLAGLRRMLHANRGAWEMTFVDGGQAALDLLAQQSFDVVVTDIRMPVVDGTQVLAYLRQHQPEVARIVLSGDTNATNAMRAVPVAHQFLAKPCDSATLEATVKRVCAVQDRLRQPALRRILGEIDTLPSPPATILALNAVLADPNGDIDEVVDAIGDDVAISAKLLQLVNSAFFGLAHRVSSIRQAVTYLGLRTVRDLAVTVETFKAFDTGGPTGRFIASLTEHASATASMARALTSGSVADQQDAFVAGLLHDVGLLALMATMPERLKELEAEADAAAVPLAAVEADTLGATHADLGAHLLTLWGLPFSVVEAVARHHDAPEVTGPGVGPAHAVFIADAASVPGPGERVAAPVDADYLDSLGIDMGCLAPAPDQPVGALS